MHLNLGGNSSITAYEIGNDFIKVEFEGTKIYTYTYASAGAHHIEQMKILASKGVGLGSYIQK
jgi:hypothetical protein